VSFAVWLRAAFARSDRLRRWRSGRWRFGWALAATATALVLFVLLTIGAWVAVRAFLVGDGASFAAATAERAGPLVGNPFSLLNFLSLGLVGLAIVWAAAAVQGRSLAQYVTLGGDFRWSRFRRMAAAFVALQAVAIPLTLALQAESVTLRPGAFVDPIFLAACIAAIAVQSFGEELFFRSFLFYAWGAVWPRPLAVAIGTSAFFAAVHAWNPDIAIDPIPGLASIFLFALFAQWLVMRTGSLDAAWGLHFANNLVAFLIIQGRPGYDSDTSVLEYTDAVWAHGGSYAGSPLYWLALAGGFAVLAWLVADRRSPFHVEPAQPG
jgi:uncharacterized protein